jgi:hypothetical protein
MLRYLKDAERLRDSAALAGTTDWGDQMALNMYCRSNPELWQEIDESWNYCLWGRDPNQIRIRQDGRIEGGCIEIHVAHGNASTLEAVRGYHHIHRALAAKRRSILL